MNIVPFEIAFEALTGNRPFKWQSRMYEKLIAAVDSVANDKIPDVCSIPTGLGKTSIIPIWLIALANSHKLPRRLIYIVNRRTVVDQATDDVMKILSRLYQVGKNQKLSWATDELAEKCHFTEQPVLQDECKLAVEEIISSCTELSGDETTIPLAVSTLRGELADNREWRSNPARPAIIVGTIDMIGSKLLFSGYGDRQYGRAHHAGLIGQDTLIIHDESHLTPAFSSLLESVKEEQERELDKLSDDSPELVSAFSPIKVMELSATDIPTEESKTIFKLGQLDKEDEIVLARLNAKKTMQFVEVETSKTLMENIATEAASYDSQGCRVLVYVNTPKNAREIVSKIAGKINIKGEEIFKRIGVLTGTIRGHERDQLVDSDLFKAFKSDPNRPEKLDKTVYLVSTSAGEVGADFDADHMICDVTPIDSMIQRLGRVNRLGGHNRSANIVVVCNKQEFKGKLNLYGVAKAKTVDILRDIADDDQDVSPEALNELRESKDYKEALSPIPQILPTSDILFDMWSLSSITKPLPGRPNVEPYLHGVADHNYPRIRIAWRSDVSYLAKANADKLPSEDDLERVFKAFPIRSAERMQCRIDHFFKELNSIATRMPDERAILITSGTIEWVTLDELKDLKGDTRLNEAQVVLPCEVGGLQNGFLDGSVQTPACDVAEIQGDRQRVYDDTLQDKIMSGLTTHHEIILQDGEFGDSVKSIQYKVDGSNTRDPGERMLLSVHANKTEQAAERIVKSLSIMEPIASAITQAARHHDSGKGRKIWQCYAKNNDPNVTLAKFKGHSSWKVLGGFRHEFASLIDATKHKNLLLAHPERDLILHLIAAHHGRARPDFSQEAYDKESGTKFCHEISIESLQRFGRLQRRFGRWVLVWLESLVRCADQIGSKEMENK